MPRIDNVWPWSEDMALSILRKVGINAGNQLDGVERLHVPLRGSRPPRGHKGQGDPPVTNMSVHAMAAIRDARGLTPEQKTILYTVESRGEVFSTADVLRADCGGMSRDRFYRHRNPLIEQGLLRAERRGTGKTTRYRVDREAVEALGGNDASLSVLEILTPDRLEMRTPDGLEIVTSGRLETGTQREPISGPPKGSTQRGPFYVDSQTPHGVLHRISEPIYIRLVRPSEMTTPQKHLIGEMPLEERSEWNELIETEASLP